MTKIVSFFYFKIWATCMAEAVTRGCAPHTGSDLRQWVGLVAGVWAGLWVRVWLSFVRW